MAYSINPNLPKARAFAMKLLICEQLPLLVVARKCGVNRSTIWRWKCKWNELNQNVQLTNYNRPSRKQTIPSSQFRLNAIRWNIPTVSSCPHFCPWTLSDELVHLVLLVREQLNHYAEVVWHYIVTVLEIKISLSSVRRILRRNH